MPPYIWMPSYVWMAHIMFDCPHVWTPPVSLHAPHVWTPPICLDAHFYLDTPCMFACPICFVAPPVCLDAPPLCLDTPVCLDVLMPPIHTQHKESMLCHTEGVSICPIHLDAFCMFGCPSCLDIPHMFGCPHMFEYPAVCLGDVWMPLYIHNT